MAESIKARFDLTGKVAIVTGASKGIGESIARGLAEFGAKVMVSSRKQESIDAVAKAIKAAGGEADAVAAATPAAPPTCRPWSIRRSPASAASTSSSITPPRIRFSGQS